jgi:predicted DsbA family dithiol-disulfide isomerase
MGTRYHHDSEDIDEPDILKEILKSCGFATGLSDAVDEQAWDKIITDDMDQAIAKVGTDVGVPLIVLDGGKGPGKWNFKPLAYLKKILFPPWIVKLTG